MSSSHSTAILEHVSLAIAAPEKFHYTASSRLTGLWMAMDDANAGNLEALILQQQLWLRKSAVFRSAICCRNADDI